MIDWNALKRLRANFLSEEPGAGGDYWKSEAELESYEATFAQRIGWKWDAVLDEIAALGWKPEGTKLLDWGCGTGLAARKFVERWPMEVSLWDRSERAMEFALARTPGAKKWDGSAPSVWLLSHVLNEVRDIGIVRQAETIFFVEPGTPALSRRLIEIREDLRKELNPIAPCPHAEKCGIGGRDWCHHFAPPPRKVFTSAEWSRFGKEMGIDLRALPVSYLVMSRRTFARPDTRVVGRARVYKGYALPLICRREGVREEKIMSRHEPERVKRLERDPGFVER